MLQIVSLTLFAVYTFSVHAQWGSAGQDCTPGDDDNLPELCTASGQIINDTSKIECKQNFDCCLCGEVRCEPQCDSFKANGDQSAYYVPNVYIVGNEDKGADIDCNGDSSCEGTVIDATNIKTIKCSGDRSCFSSHIDAECLEPCKLECDGDNACSDSIIDVTNVADVECAENACSNATLSITNPDDEFRLKCSSVFSCTEATINIVIDGNIQNNIKTIECGSYRACQDATITITNTGTEQVNIEKLKCHADDACLNAEIIVEGNVVVEDCACTADACSGLKTTGFTCDGAAAARKQDNNMDLGEYETESAYDEWPWVVWVQIIGIFVCSLCISIGLMILLWCFLKQLRSPSHVKLATSDNEESVEMDGPIYCTCATVDVEHSCSETSMVITE